MDFDYKKYSLENLEKWIEDAVNSSEASPQEIYDVIKRVVKENYYCYKNSTERCYELLALLNGNGNFSLSEVLKEREYYEGVTDDGMRSWGHSDLEYQIANQKKDKVVKWRLPVEVVRDEDTDRDEYCVTFPDDLLEAANLKEGDTIEWVDQGDGSYLLKKVNG